MTVVIKNRKKKLRCYLCVVLQSRLANTWRGVALLLQISALRGRLVWGSWPFQMAASLISEDHIVWFSTVSILSFPFKCSFCEVTSWAGMGAEGAGRYCFHGSGASAGKFPELLGKLSRTPPATGRGVGRSAVWGAGAVLTAVLTLTHLPDWGCVAATSRASWCHPFNLYSPRSFTFSTFVYFSTMHLCMHVCVCVLTTGADKIDSQ